MNLDEAKALLESQGFEVRKKPKVTYDGSFMGLEMKVERMDSSTSQKPVGDDLEQLRMDAAKARVEMMETLDPSANTRGDSYAGKPTQQLRDIARANRDSYCGRVEGYLG